MHSYISKFVNRETEQHLLDIVGDYAGGNLQVKNSIFVNPYRLKIFVTKRRHLGKIYVEPWFIHHHEPRKYLTSYYWSPKHNSQVLQLIHQLYGMYHKARDQGVDASHLWKQMIVFQNDVDDYLLQPKTRKDAGYRDFVKRHGHYKCTARP